MDARADFTSPRSAVEDRIIDGRMISSRLRGLACYVVNFVWLRLCYFMYFVDQFLRFLLCNVLSIADTPR